MSEVPLYNQVGACTIQGAPTFARRQVQELGSGGWFRRLVQEAGGELSTGGSRASGAAPIRHSPMSNGSTVSSSVLVDLGEGPQTG